ncbi:uncharacterized protein LOC134535638 [Bacillus rossius redtenbacheri]|uniref:uncharacterized protein LOC134535638 n=1 Tax=Bacillus rossius redtenbacheri TaxID=93214 RepID=UPI002FDD6D06
MAYEKILLSLTVFTFLCVLQKAFVCVLLCSKLINPETCQVNNEGVKEMSKKCGKTKQEKEKMIKAGNTCQAQVAKKVKSCEPATEAADVICKCLMAQNMF